MTLDDYLRDLRRRRRLLMRLGVPGAREWRDVRVCCSPDLHRREYYHAGQQSYYCAICERIKVA